MNAKPSKVQTMSILVLINGIINILWGGLLALLIIIGTIGIGLLCAPILILPMVLGVVEIIYALNLMAEPPKVNAPSMAIAILEICSILFLNVFGVVVGVLSLVFINEEEVKSYFAGLEPPSSAG
ncbi:MAG: hypothetical protein ACK2TT_03105 [Anaerolineales bacterium]